MRQSVKTICTGIFCSLIFVTSSYSLSLDNETNPEEKAIESIRKGTLHIKGLPGATVQVEQLKHEFWLGCAISSGVFVENVRMSTADITMYKEKFLENFNSAVTENAVKWGSMERRRGVIDYKTADNILDWTEENNLPCRGHNLYWGINKFVQSWVKQLNKEELREAVKERGIKTANHYKGRFAEYDLNNEMIHGNYYAQMLGDGITREMADWVLEGDINAKLWVNDYDILTGERLDDYIQHIKELLKQGVPVAGIGVQGHLHEESFSRTSLKECLDSLRQFGLPIRITEFNIPGQRSKYYRDKSIKMTEAEEMQKAKDLTDYYRICFAHPSVEGILMWGFWEGANWIKTSSLYKRDWSPTPALKAYQELIFNEWNTSVSLKLDKDGEASLTAFFGDYKISSEQKEISITLEKRKGHAEVELRD
ncbi:MAG: glycoside hydrolase [Bacteroidetes bacterium]|nr:MAG: glycoside hydrolase [Bacteroidota bacterium]